MISHSTQQFMVFYLQPFVDILSSTAFSPVWIFCDTFTLSFTWLSCDLQPLAIRILDNLIFSVILIFYNPPPTRAIWLFYDVPAVIVAQIAWAAVVVLYFVPVLVFPCLTCLHVLSVCRMYYFRITPFICDPLSFQMLRKSLGCFCTLAFRANVMIQRTSEQCSTMLLDWISRGNKRLKGSGFDTRALHLISRTSYWH